MAEAGGAPEGGWIETIAKGLGAGGVFMGVLALVRAGMERIFPSADRRSRERVDLLEQANRSIANLQRQVEYLAKRLEEEQVDVDRYRLEAAELREAKATAVERASVSEIEHNQLRGALERAAGHALNVDPQPTPPAEPIVQQRKDTRA